MSLLIRPEREEDYPRITEINDRAFGQPGEGKLIERLRLTENFIPELSLVAEQEGALAGHILFSRIVIVSGSAREPSIALAPMSVRPEWQKKGIGSQLVRDGLRRAKELGHGSVIVLGHPEYYPRFGFQPASRWDIRSPFEAPDAAFLALELDPGALAGKSGVVEYPPEFQEV